MACFNNGKYLVVLLFLLIMPVSAISCELTFDGSQFLRSSYSKGISPETNCHVADVNGNRFYSLPNKSCKVTFSTSSWLNKDWAFKSIQGMGTFSVQRSSSGINIIIKKKGGFRLTKVTLQSQTVSCKNTTVEAVL